MQNSPHYVISFFGIIRAGGVVVNLNPMFKALELEPIIEKTGFKTVITQYTLCPEFLKTSNAGLVRTVIVARFANFLGDHPLYDPPPEARGLTKNFPGTIDFKEMMTAGQPIPVCRIENMDTDLAMLELTGGTTGVPKAAMISVRSFSLAVAVCCNWYRLTPTDTSLGVAPFFHIMGLQVTMVPCLVAGCRLPTAGHDPFCSANHCLGHRRARLYGLGCRTHHADRPGPYAERRGVRLLLFEDHRDRWIASAAQSATAFSKTRPQQPVG